MVAGTDRNHVSHAIFALIRKRQYMMALKIKNAVTALEAGLPAVFALAYCALFDRLSYLRIARVSFARKYCVGRTVSAQIVDRVGK